MPTNMQTWTLLVPIYNLEIEEDIGGELAVGDILFVRADKIPRIRRRLGLYLTVGEYKRNMPIQHMKADPFQMAPTYAAVRSNRAAEDPLNVEFHRIRDAVYLLASSQFFRVKRHHRELFGPPEFSRPVRDSYPVLCNDSKAWQWGNSFSGRTQPYRLDSDWRQYIKHHHFPNLLKILGGKLDVTPKWRGAIKRAAILAGQSMFAQNLWQAFMCDMIALESLLTKRGDKFPEALIQKAVLFFGWMTAENSEYWKEIISRLYSLRCQFVHDGQDGDITVTDLHQADVMLGNLLRNVCNTTALIREKEDIVQLAEQYKARQVLGMHPRTPIGFSYIDQPLWPQDVEELEKKKHWWW